MVYFLTQSLFHLCASVRLAKFTTNLFIKSKTKTNNSYDNSLPFMCSILFGLLLNEHEFCFFLLSYYDFNFSINLKLPRKSLSFFFSRVLFVLISVYIFYLSNTIPCGFISLVTFQICCHSFSKRKPRWLLTLLILLSNDIHQNPGPFQNSYFTFMNWNISSLSKDDFHRLRLLEAQNSIFSYDLISLSVKQS